MRQKSSDEFRMTLNQQPNNTIGEGATLDLIFKKGIGNGVSVTDQGKIQEMTVMKVKSLPTADSLEKTQHNISLKKQVEGNYNATLNNLFTSISINSLDIQNKLSGTVNLIDGKKCNLNGILSQKSGYLSLVLNFQTDCGICAGTVIIKLNDGKASGFFTSNDGSVNFNLVLNGPARL